MKKKIVLIISVVMSIAICAFGPIGSIIVNSMPNRKWLALAVVCLFFIFMINSILQMLIGYFDNNKKDWKHLPLTVVFLGLIFIPFLIRDNFNESKENRTETQKPVFLTEEGDFNFSYPTEYQNWFDDHFGFRSLLSDSYSNLAYKLFNVSTNDTVLVGKDNWLFYANKGDGDPMGDYQNIELYTDEQLLTMKSNLEDVYTNFQQNDIDFIFIIAPNKSSVYGEYYPEYINKVQAQSRLDQFVGYMSENSDVPVLDLRAELINNKDKNQLYHKADTHWNNYGAFIGYTDIMNYVSTLYPEVEPDPISSFEVNKTDIDENSGKDLLNMANIDGSSYNGELFDFKFDGNVKYNVDKKEGANLWTTVDNDSLPSAIFYHDSFGTAIKPFVSNNFSSTHYIRKASFLDSSDQEYVLEQQPDIVLCEVAERYLDLLIY